MTGVVYGGEHDLFGINDSSSRRQFKEICGVKIQFKPSADPDTPSWEEWEEILEEMLPLYDEAGWLDGFAQISIESGIVSGDAVARYFCKSAQINMEVDVDLEEYSGYVLDDSKKHILTHEIIHHVHMNIRGNKEDGRYANTELMRSEVSQYATMNVLEAIAEIGAGIALGHEFPEEIHDFYERHDGPPEVYDFG